MTFLGSAPWAGKRKTHAMNTQTTAGISLLFIFMGIPFFLRSMARNKRREI
jgi:hypothetical protein